MGCHFLLQGIFPTQGSNPHLLHWQVILCHWATREAYQCYTPILYSFFLFKKKIFKYISIILPLSLAIVLFICCYSFSSNSREYNLCGVPRCAVVKNLSSDAGYPRDVGSIPRSGRSPEVGNSNVLQYSCLENPLDRGAWHAEIHGVAKSCTWLSS